MNINKKELELLLGQTTDQKKKEIQRKKNKLLERAADNMKRVVMAKLSGRMADC